MFVCFSSQYVIPLFQTLLVLHFTVEAIPVNHYQTNLYFFYVFQLYKDNIFLFNVLMFKYEKYALACNQHGIKRPQRFFTLFDRDYFTYFLEKYLLNQYLPSFEIFSQLNFGAREKVFYPKYDTLRPEATITFGHFLGHPKSGPLGCVFNRPTRIFFAAGQAITPVYSPDGSEITFSHFGFPPRLTFDTTFDLFMDFVYMTEDEAKMRIPCPRRAFSMFPRDFADQLSNFSGHQNQFFAARFINHHRRLDLQEIKTPWQRYSERQDYPPQDLGDHVISDPTPWQYFYMYSKKRQVDKDAWSISIDDIM